MHLVLGITGKVGGATARHLLRQGKQVRALEFHIFQEGRISVTRHMEDWMSLFRQIGALPPAL
jgi:nucleoside-diphosphate-sugar epimerase